MLTQYTSRWITVVVCFTKTLPLEWYQKCWNSFQESLPRDPFQKTHVMCFILVFLCACQNSAKSFRHPWTIHYFKSFLVLLYFGNNCYRFCHRWQKILCATFFQQLQVSALVCCSCTHIILLNNILNITLANEYGYGLLPLNLKKPNKELCMLA